MSEPVHGGVIAVRALKSLGVEHLFVLTGGHIFPFLDAARTEGLRIADFRHEQSAGYAAEAWSRLTRTLGVCAVTAGPGVTNIMSPLAQAGFNSASVLALAGRAPTYRWGQGSLQEIDHVPFVAPLAEAKTVQTTDAIAEEILAAARRALIPPRGPQFLDFPLEVLFNTASVETNAPDAGRDEAATFEQAGEVARLIEHAQRPVLVAGSNVWLDRAEQALRALVEAAEIPTIMNGQGRGCLPADHRLAFARSRSAAFKQADLVIVAGAPLDFRLGFGQGFAPDAKVVHLDPGPVVEHVPLAVTTNPTRLDVSLAAIASEIGTASDTKPWIEALRAVEEDNYAQAQEELRSDARPIHPMRLYGELVPLLERNAVVIGDGGDFVSYAGREVPSFEPGCWLDPGPYGCLGCGPGYAMAARLAHPDRQIVLLLGDGAIGFSGTELETMVRLKLPIVCVVGNNGIWGLEKHPMRALYGHDVAAELQPGIRYDLMMESFGGRGELVEDPDDIGPALKRAFDAGEPYLVNVLTDPEIAYPRSANLA
ncbi:MAG TPA: acetolactate synthase [Actinomycetota bacterium]|nr:acetolactate synthase [Actinomycetota bacterium]